MEVADCVHAKAVWVKLYEHNFHSERAAELSGEKVLRALLKSVTKEAPDA
jgi:hypothetical protein